MLKSYPGIITIDVSSVPSGKKEGKKDKGRIKILTGREREGGETEREQMCVCVFIVCVCERGKAKREKEIKNESKRMQVR